MMMDGLDHPKCGRELLPYEVHVADTSGSPKSLKIYGVRGSLNIPYPVDSFGNRVCRWCHGDLPRNRSSWCSRECRTEYEVSGGLWNAVQSAVYRRDNLSCQHCSRRDPYVHLEVDHIKPVVEGGDDRLSNLRLLCTDCHKVETADLRNRRKGVA